jgi:hypothetical protein
VGEGDGHDRRDYDELKAKLGLKAEKKPASSADKTPPGGFDMGLERGAHEITAPDTVENSVHAGPASVGDSALVRSSSTRLLTIGLLVLGFGFTTGVGYWWKYTEDNRLYADRQIKDASTLLSKVQQLGVTGGTCTALSSSCTVQTECANGFCVAGRCNDLRHGSSYCDADAACTQSCPEGAECECVRSLDTALYRYVGAISRANVEAASITTRLRSKEPITDAQYKVLDQKLSALHAESVAYVKKQPRIFAKSFLSESVFNGEAVILVVQEAASLEILFNAATMMAREDETFKLFQSFFDPAKVRAPAVNRAWKFLQGSTSGFFAAVKIILGKDGKPLIRKEEVPASKRRGKDSPQYRQLIRYEFEDEEIKKKLECHKPENKDGCEWSPSEMIVQRNLKSDLQPVLTSELAKYQAGYQKLLRFRLMDRTRQLDEAASGLLHIRANGQEGGVHHNTRDKLSSLAKKP